MVKPLDTAAAPEAVDRSLQLQVEAAALAEFASSKEAERVARLEADRDLVYELALRRYEGEAWRKFATALAEYGLQVVKAWVSTGRMFLECKRRGLGLGMVQQHRTRDDVLDLAGETVAVSLAAFREKVLIPGKWDATRGATLKTFFVGQCVYQFPNVYRRWARETSSAVPDPAEVVETSVTPQITTMIHLQRTLAAMPPEDVRHLLILVEMGHSAAEIAELTGASKRSVESRLYRHRTQKAKP
jgi:DNA-directed RNA polymerase specialized sigma24 family protein